MRTYSDAIYRDVRRLWFGGKRGLTNPPLNGPAHPGSEAENLVYVERYYPQGPIKILKFGAMAASTHGKGEGIISLYRNASRLATAVCSTTASEYTIDSVAVNKVCAAGSYLNLIASTNVCSTGSIACFIDYIPQYDNTRRWGETLDGRANRVAV
jgi:hypothetical protein